VTSLQSADNAKVMGVLQFRQFVAIQGLGARYKLSNEFRLKRGAVLRVYKIEREPTPDVMTYIASMNHIYFSQSGKRTLGRHLETQFVYCTG